MAQRLPVLITNAADQAAVLGVAGSPIKLLFRISKMPRSYRSFERALVDSVDPRSVRELALMDPINRRCFKLLPEPMVTR
jgi:hypothetical protein